MGPFSVAGGCDRPLGMESGAIPDEAITASSSYVPNVGPRNGRFVENMNMIRITIMPICKVLDFRCFPGTLHIIEAREIRFYFLEIK